MDDERIALRIYLNEDGTVDQIVPSGYYGQIDIEYIRQYKPAPKNICTCKEEGPEPHTHEQQFIRIFKATGGGD